MREKGTADIKFVVPPRRTAARSPSARGTWAQRDAAVARISEVGRRGWRKQAGAHPRARVENAMYTLESTTGDRLMTRSFEAQKQETAIRVRALNIMTEFGMPESYSVVA